LHIAYLELRPLPSTGITRYVLQRITGIQRRVLFSGVDSTS
jgi:hypothetical protein